MVRTKLKDFSTNISAYLGIPYFINTSANTDQSEDVLVGKGTAKEIALKTIKYAEQSHIDLRLLTALQIYNFQKKHRLGIDCSGLVYHLLELLEPNIDNLLIGTEGKRGVRRLSADLLTSPPNAFPVNNFRNLKTGDLIRMDNGHHVIFIINKQGNFINYIHSSQKTRIKGVHYGQIKIINPRQPLENQTWSDITIGGKPYPTLIDSSKKDGVYRPFFLK